MFFDKKKRKGKMKAKILASVILISAVIAGGYAASQALFQDTETSTNSSFTVGTLDLDVEGKNGESDRFDVTNIGADGTISGGKTWTINNTGSLPGVLSFSLENLSNTENGCNEPESTVDTTCGNPGENEGELGNAISTNVLFGNESILTSNFATENQGAYAAAWENQEVVIPAGQSVEVTMNWSTSPENYGNEIQSDSLTFDVAFTLEQVNPNQ